MDTDIRKKILELLEKEDWAGIEDIAREKQRARMESILDLLRTILAVFDEGAATRLTPPSDWYPQLKETFKSIETLRDTTPSGIPQEE